MAGFRISKLSTFLVTIILIISAFPSVEKVSLLSSADHIGTNGITSGSSGSRALSWQLIETLDRTVVVPEGSDYYVQLDTVSGVLREKKLPAAEAGLNGSAREAVAIMPAWLQKELALKLRETASTQINSLIDDASPCFADIDNDGDLDLILGQGFGGLLLFRNEGNQFQHVFVMDRMFFSEANYQASQLLIQFASIAPTAADYDGDYDVDLVVGNRDGRLVRMENTGTPSEPKFESVVLEEGRRPTGNSVPFLVDFDADSDLDMIVGDGSGKLDVYLNVGSTTNPQWSRDITNPLSEIQVAGYAAPFLSDMDGDGDLDISIGDSSNVISYYRCVTSGITKNYVLDESMYLGLELGTNNHPALVDIDGDGLVELCTGSIINENTGVIYFYENYGNIRQPRWNIWSSYQAVPGVSYYPPVEFLQYLEFSFTDKFADIIMEAFWTDPLWVDEVGFSIAHTPAFLLKYMEEDHVQLFYDNAKYIYEIDKHLAYADVIEHNPGTEDYYSTVLYRTRTNGGTVTREYPRDIYYWYIVHPKITEEYPAYINPENGYQLSPSEGGRFWREYLFYHNDPAYPPDNSGSSTDGIDDYPTTFGPPLLKDLLSGITYLWNDTSYYAPGGRDPEYGSNAIIRVSNWVGKTLILNQQEVSDDERPTQPVRIAHHHNGNCGELQDLTAAAARTALIPAVGVNLVAEDHVWNEFYENGWKQWDNHWSDAGSYIDRHDLYWYGWRERGGSGIWLHRGDDDTTDVTQHYVPGSAQSKVYIKVLDRHGQPVDGARVLVGSHWMAERNIEQVDVTFPFPGIWNYTDSQGEAEFHLAKQNFTIKILSKVGNAVQEKTYIGAGGTYYFNFTLEGLVPRPQLQTQSIPSPSPPDPTYRIELEFAVAYGVQQPPNPESGFYHPEEQVRSNRVNFFMTDEANFNDYQAGMPFEVMNFQPGVSNYKIPEVLFISQANWFFVLSNLNMLETAKRVQLTLRLYKPQFEVPFLSINSPLNNSVVFVGETETIEGSVQDEDGISSVLLEIINLESEITVISRQLPYNDDEYWSFDWDTGKNREGLYRVEVTARDNKGYTNKASIHLSLILAGAPEIMIAHPLQDQTFDIGEIVEVNGTIADNGYLTAVTLSFGGGNPIDITTTMDEGHFKYLWDTRYEDAGFVEIIISAEDNDGNIALKSRVIELLTPPPVPDTTPPELAILSPEYGSQIRQGTLVLVQGYAYDENEIVDLYLTFGDLEGLYQVTMTGETQWSYEWDTSTMPLGEMTITINAQDYSNNHGSYEIIVTILEALPQVDDIPPEVFITFPADNAVISAGEIIVVTGTATDNIGIVKFELSSDDGKTWYDLTSTITGINWEFIIDTDNPKLWPDLYTITVRASDDAGNVGEMEIAVSIIDDTPPVLEIIKPGNKNRFDIDDTIEFTGFATDNFQVERLQMRMGEERRWTDKSRNLDSDTGSWSVEVEAFELSVGQNTVYFKLTDIHGNEVEDETIVIIQADTEDAEDTNVISEILEFLIYGLPGLFLCGTFFIIVAVVVYAATRPGRRKELED